MVLKPLPLDALLLLRYDVRESNKYTLFLPSPLNHTDTSHSDWQHHTAQSLACCTSTQSSQVAVSGAPFTSLNHNTTNQAGEWKDSSEESSHRAKSQTTSTLYNSRSHCYIYPSFTDVIFNTVWLGVDTKSRKIDSHDSKHQRQATQTLPIWASTNLSANLREKSFKVFLWRSRELLFFADSNLSLLLDIKKKIQHAVPFSVSSCALTWASWTSTWCEVAERRSLLLQSVRETLLGFLNCTAQLSALSMLTAHRHSTFGEGALLNTSLPLLLPFFFFLYSLSLYFAVTTINRKAPPSGHYFLCLLLTHTCTMARLNNKDCPLARGK